MRNELSPLCLLNKSNLDNIQNPSTSGSHSTQQSCQCNHVSSSRHREPPVVVWLRQCWGWSSQGFVQPVPLAHTLDQVIKQFAYRSTCVAEKLMNIFKTEFLVLSPILSPSSQLLRSNFPKSPRVLYLGKTCCSTFRPHSESSWFLLAIFPCSFPSLAWVTPSPDCALARSHGNSSWSGP